MLVLRWIAAVISIAVGLYCVLFNAFIALRVRLSRSRSVSVIPFMGGVLTATGVLLVPTAHNALWAVLPLVLDVGCIPMAVALLVHWLRARQNKAA